MDREGGIAAGALLALVGAFLVLRAVVKDDDGETLVDRILGLNPSGDSDAGAAKTVAGAAGLASGRTLSGSVAGAVQDAVSDAIGDDDTSTGFLETDEHEAEGVGAEALAGIAVPRRGPSLRDLARQGRTAGRRRRGGR